MPSAIDGVTAALRGVDTFTKLYIDGKFVSTAQTMDCICERHAPRPCNTGHEESSCKIRTFGARAVHSCTVYAQPCKQPCDRHRCFATTRTACQLTRAFAFCRAVLRRDSQTRRQGRCSTRRPRPAPTTCAWPLTQRRVPTRPLSGPTSPPRLAQSELHHDTWPCSCAPRGCRRPCKCLRRAPGICWGCGHAYSLHK
jgi:hypothetical protein